MLPFPFEKCVLDANGRIPSVSVAGAGIPAGAQYAGGVAFSQSGQFYYDDSGVPANAPDFGGLSTRVDGALLTRVDIAVGGTASAQNAYQRTANGRIFTTKLSPIDHYTNGVPFDSTGRVCIS